MAKKSVDEETLAKLRRSVIAPYAKLARHVSTMAAASRFTVPEAMSQDELLETFRLEWLPQILKHAADGPMVLKIVTDIPVTEPLQLKLEKFFDGTGFSVSQFEEHGLHPKFAVHSFIISWLE